MHLSSVVVFAALSSIALAQNLIDQIPTCASTCFGSNFGGCAPLDIGCICANKDLLSSLSCCIAGGCSAEDQETTIQFASDLCQANGVTVASSAFCASTSAPTASGTANSTTTPTGSTTPDLTLLSGTATAGSATAESTAAAPLHTAGSCAGLGIGFVVAGLLVA